MGVGDDDDDMEIEWEEEEGEEKDDPPVDLPAFEDGGEVVMMYLDQLVEQYGPDRRAPLVAGAISLGLALDIERYRYNMEDGWVKPQVGSWVGI